MKSKPEYSKMLLVSGSALLLTGCVTTTPTYSLTEIRHELTCETIERVRYKPKRTTYATLPKEDQDHLKRVLDYARLLECPQVSEE
jgi:hypothetical protein